MHPDNQEPALALRFEQQRQLVVSDEVRGVEVGADQEDGDSGPRKRGFDLLAPALPGPDLCVVPELQLAIPR
jgi:hypothetical protein